AMVTRNEGSLASFLADDCPTVVRDTGFAVSCNVGNALVGGTAPAIAALRTSKTGDPIAPGWYLPVAARIARIAVPRCAATSGKPRQESPRTRAASASLIVYEPDRSRIFMSRNALGS